LNTVLIISAFVFIISVALTYAIRKAALHHELMDIPNERSSHYSPVPKGGGLAIIICWYLGISGMFYLDYIESKLYFALLSGTILAIVSFFDDIYDIKPVIRLVIQTLAAILAFVFLGGIDHISLFLIEIDSVFFLYPACIIGIVWFINLFNFLDGIDGYASSEAIMISFFMFAFTGDFINIVLVASVLGFLIWNWPKARIFMGDIGSTQLGFIIIVLGLYFHNESKLDFINWIMLSSLFWFDATLTLYRRWRNKEKLSTAHRKHAYQRAVQSGFSHQEINFLSILINFVLAGFVYASIRLPAFQMPLLIVNILLLYGVTLMIDRRYPFK
jgi:Fuc2NAc and GlcNAc transferase